MSVAKKKKEMSIAHPYKFKMFQLNQLNSVSRKHAVNLQRSMAADKNSAKYNLRGCRLLQEDPVRQAH